ncbi:MAG: DUF4173 domain-containing protein [Flavobacteriales bacterium]|nr:DUF4173 domain-containing protein [Flavobacteriales bacterium]
MKKNDWIILAATGVYSYLFYKEMLGINLSIFTLILLIFAIIQNVSLLRNRNWVIVAFLSLIASISVAYYGNLLSIIATITSLLVLTGMSASAKSSIFIASIYGLNSWFLSGIDDINQLPKRFSKEQTPNSKKLMLIGISIFVAFLFFGMYRVSNPIFESITNKINLDWISIYWISFTLLGLWLIYGFYNVKYIEDLQRFDEPESLKITNYKHEDWSLWGKTLTLVDEYFSAKVLFILLNLLILIVNLGDMNFLLFNQELPENLTFASFLHQGVGTLIFSIIISIAIVLFYFRGAMNFFKNNKLLKILAYIWLIQNLILLVSVGVKNTMYIDIYGLTYKRIGVYVYTFLTFIGLISTILKIYLVKKNLFLFRMNGWSFFLVLIFSAVINWDQLIVNTNQSLKREIDLYYMLSLSDATLPSLIKMEKNIKDEGKKRFFHKRMKRKINVFKSNQAEKTWKSWNYVESKIKL